MMTNIELANKLKNIAKNYKTLYVMGCFGAPMTATNKKRYTQNHSYNKQASSGAGPATRTPSTAVPPTLPTESRTSAQTA